MTEMQENRKAAKEAGEKYFNVSYPCKKGHDSPRLTSTGVCVQCAREAQQEYRKHNQEKCNAYARHRRQTKREECRAYMNAYMKRYRKTKKGREKMNAANRKWGKRVRDELRQAEQSA